MRCSQTTATLQHNISQHCWLNICKIRPNNRKVSAQHIATLLGATCCERLATQSLLQRVATWCWILKIELVRTPGCSIVARTWPNDHNIMQRPQMSHEKFYQFQIWANNTQHVATLRNMSQQGGQTHATCCAWQCCDRLCWNFSFSCGLPCLIIYMKNYSILTGLEQCSSSVTRQCKKCNSVQKV